ncbi:MAG: hypothetical protein RLN75_00345 [Longimicrobiales bacterium]
MRRTVPVLAALAATLAACSDTPVSPLDSRDPTITVRPEAAASGVAFVGSSADSGPGTLRDAANSSSVRTIVVRRGLGTIVLESPIVFAGGQDLRIDGNGVTIDGSGVAYTPEAGVTEDADPSPSALQFTGGGDVAIRDLRVTESTGHGIYVPVPSSASGRVDVFLTRVVLDDNGLSGLWIDDQLADSDASVTARLNDVHVLGNGFRPDVSDYDGVRVNEGGTGSLRIELNRVRAEDNAGDGVEVDETGAGDVWMWSRLSTYDDNGTQPQNPADLEDGLDADEAGPGSIIAYVQGGTISGNRDEGFDLDEEGTGDIRAVVVGVTLRGNGDENVSYTEDEELEAGGDIVHVFHNVTSEASEGGDGIKLEDFGPGDLKGTMSNMELNDNDDEGIQYEEVGDGDLEVRIVDADIEGNGGGGIQVEQLDAGGGVIRLRNVDFDGNGDGPEDDIKDEGVVVRDW